MHARIAIVALVCSFLVIAVPSRSAAAPSDGKHTADVIRFFSSHPKLARTPAGQRQLWLILARLESSLQARQLQSAEASTWPGAVRVVGRYFGPGIAAWELRCSQTGSEGGWGRWFWNGGAVVNDTDRLRYLASASSPPQPTGSSGAGGWLQFMKSTFDGVIGAAIVEAQRRGMFVPGSARSWLSPLGQALAGAEMLLEHRTGEWTGWACS